MRVVYEFFCWAGLTRVGKPPLEEAVGGKLVVYGESVLTAFDWVMSLPDIFELRACLDRLCRPISNCRLTFAPLDLRAFCDGFGARRIGMMFPNAAQYRVGFF